MRTIAFLVLALALGACAPPPPIDVETGREPEEVAPISGPSSDDFAPLVPRTTYTIFGVDQRRRVTPTDYFPASAQVRLVLAFADGYIGYGSGTLVGTKYVLTAGHCVYSQDHGWASQVTAFPGEDGHTKPYTAHGILLRSTTNWVNNGDDDYDYGLITLDSDEGVANGWMTMAVLSDTKLDNTWATLAGYPADKPFGEQYMNPTPELLSGSDSAKIYYLIDSAEGMSGAALYTELSDFNYYIIGVHHGDGYDGLTHYNEAVRITSARRTLIESWIASGR